MKVFKLQKMKGGIHPDFHKQESTRQPSRTLPLPDQLIIPVRQMSGPVEDFKVLIEVGAYVNKGQPMIQCDRCTLHAPTSGTINAIEKRPVPHPSGLSDNCVILDADGKDDWGEALYPPYQDFRQVPPEQLIQRVWEAGVVGLGGAVFPTRTKLGRAAEVGIDTFIINAAECEPYITCDDMLAREKAAHIITGIKIVQHILQPKHCLIGIEDNKPEAIAALQHALSAEQSCSIQLVVIPSIYPSGDEKQLIHLLTHQKIRKDKLAIDNGVLVQNIATVLSVYDAVVKGRPLISRYVTVTGQGVQSPQNFEVLIGTPFECVINAAGGYTQQAYRLIMGGPMMGHSMATDQISVVKATNCILVAAEEELPYSTQAAMPCIRCGQCMDVCPVDLLPQQLYWYAKSEAYEKLEAHHLFNCIECGCCSYVCPSNIPLVQYYRHAKDEIRERKLEKQKSDLARERFEFREFRKQREKEERAAKLAAHKKKVQQKNKGDNDKMAAIKAAMERAKAKKAAAQEQTESNQSDS